MKEITIIQHLEELRKRIIVYLIVFIVLAGLSFNFSKKIAVYLLSRAGETIFLSPSEGFLLHLKIALLSGFLVSLPILFFQAWSFLAEALDKKETALVKVFFIMSLFLFFIGGAFSYIIILPVALKFLLSFQNPFMKAMLSANQYFNFLCMLTITFGFVFELPLIIVFLTKMNIIEPATLVRLRRHALVLIFFIAAVLTPPDVLTQFLMAIPLIILYEVGIFLSKFFVKKNKSK